MHHDAPDDPAENPPVTPADIERSVDRLGRLAGEIPGAGDLLVAARAAWAGGVAACRVYYDDDLDIQLKGIDDPVTAADHAANQAILDVLRRERPDDPVLSEESRPPDRAVDVGRLWVVDPLDGTKEFIARNGEFSVMVGLAVDGGARLGAVFQPAVGRLFAGIVDGGAWVVADAQHPRESGPLGVETRPEPHFPIRFVRSRSHPDERLQRIAAELGDIREVVSGSVGIKCALVARGMADLYVHPVPFLKEWDTCAPEALLRGAGGVVTDCEGRRLRYGKPDPRQPGGIFAATPAVWRFARPIVRDVAAPLFDGDGGPVPTQTGDS